MGEGSRPWLAKAAGKTDVRFSTVCVSDQRSLESGHEGIKRQRKVGLHPGCIGRALEGFKQESHWQI